MMSYNVISFIQKILRNFEQFSWIFFPNSFCCATDDCATNTDRPVPTVVLFSDGSAEHVLVLELFMMGSLNKKEVSIHSKTVVCRSF